MSAGIVAGGESFACLPGGSTKISGESSILDRT